MLRVCVFHRKPPVVNTNTTLFSYAKRRIHHTSPHHNQHQHQNKGWKQSITKAFRESALRTNITAAEARPWLDMKSIYKDVLHGNFGPVMLGFCLGGLCSSILGALYLSELEKKAKLRKEKRDNGELGSGDDDTLLGIDGEVVGYELPHPKLAMFGWTLMGAFVTVVIGYGRTHLRHTLKQFVEHVNYSLNILQDGKFYFRTISESHLQDMFRDNASAGALLIAAAKRTSQTSPFILLPTSDRRYLATAIINTLSPLCAPGFFALEQGETVREGWYRLALVFDEDIEEKKARKIRILIASETMLKQIIEKPSVVPKFQSGAIGKKRWELMKEMAEIVKAERNGVTDTRLIRVHLVFPALLQHPH